MLQSAFAPVAKPFVMLASLAVCLAATPALAQSPGDFTDQLRPRIQRDGDPLVWTLEARMAHYGVPGLAVAIIEDGEIVHAAGYGVLQAGSNAPVNADTVFSAGSVSKVVSATLALRLVEAGHLDLDGDILARLTSWTLPADRDVAAGTPVPLRAILSHTAGFNLHGFADFQPGDALPDVLDTLNGTAPTGDDPLAREAPSGLAYRYSGGGYTLAQLLMTDVLQQDYPELADRHLFEPLGLHRSSFSNPLPESFGNIARAHNSRGEPVALPRGYEAMPEMAASGLWVSARDLGVLVADLIQSYRGQGQALSRPMALEMMTRIAPSEHGLGPRLDGSGADFIFHHGGSNDSYRAWIEGHLVTGDGLVILTNGTQGRLLIDEIRNAVADVMGWEINRPVLAPRIALEAADLEAYAGIYSVDPAFPASMRQQMQGWIFQSDLEFRVQDGQLQAGRAGGDFFSPLVPLSPNRFAMPDFAQTVGHAEFEFHRDALGQTRGFTFHLSNAQSHYLRQ
ncbi:MAG: serine hydrolase [Maricaulis sp.]|nr:serine hydrolase [Maricaulis sp.]